MMRKYSTPVKSSVLTQKGTQNKQPNRGLASGPKITDELVLKMLTLEEGISAGNYTFQEIESLILHYAQVIEWCVSKGGDSLMKYFKEKTTLLTTKIALDCASKNMSKQAEKPSQSSSGSKTDRGPTTNSKEAFLPMPPRSPLNGAKREKTKVALNDLGRVTKAMGYTDKSAPKIKDFEEFRAMKDKEWDFEANKRRQTEQSIKSIDNILTQHSAMKQNDHLVKNSLNAQKEAMQRKLKERRERSFNRSTSKIVQKDDSRVNEPKKEGNILDGLQIQKQEANNQKQENIEENSSQNPVSGTGSSSQTKADNVFGLNSVTINRTDRQLG